MKTEKAVRLLVENINEFTEGVPVQETAFNLDRSNRQVPNFQTGRIYSDKVSDIEGGYVIVSKLALLTTKPIYNLLKTLGTVEESGGIVVPKPGTPARDKTTMIYTKL